MSLVILKELLKLVRILKKSSYFDALGITRVAHKSKQVLKPLISNQHRHNGSDRCT